MKYYVPVGRGGVFFRVGMAVTGMMGSLVYWRASRRRSAAISMEISSPVGRSRARSSGSLRPTGQSRRVQRPAIGEPGRGQAGIDR